MLEEQTFFARATQLSDGSWLASVLDAYPNERERYLHQVHGIAGEYDTAEAAFRAARIGVRTKTIVPGLVAEIDAHRDGAIIRNDLEGFDDSGWEGLSCETQSWVWGHTRQSARYNYSEDLIVVHENGGEVLFWETTPLLGALLKALGR